jgi:hypothetical protein
MNEGHLVASSAMTGGGLLTHPVRSKDLNDARVRRRNDDRTHRNQASLFVGRSLTGAPQPEANGSARHTPTVLAQIGMIHMLYKSDRVI